MKAFFLAWELYKVQYHTIALDNVVIQGRTLVVDVVPWRRLSGACSVSRQQSSDAEKGIISYGMSIRTISIKNKRAREHVM
jgi:hypothetical protein